MSINNFVDSGWDGDENDYCTDQKLFEENNARERALWGDLLGPKRILQRRGFGVWWVDREARLINVGTKIVSVIEFIEMAAREQRLSGIK